MNLHSIKMGTYAPWAVYLQQDVYDLEAFSSMHFSLALPLKNYYYFKEVNLSQMSKGNLLSRFATFGKWSFRQKPKLTKDGDFPVKI